MTDSIPNLPPALDELVRLIAFEADVEANAAIALAMEPAELMAGIQRDGGEAIRLLARQVRGLAEARAARLPMYGQVIARLEAALAACDAASTRMPS